MRAESKDRRGQACHALKSYLSALSIPFLTNLKGDVTVRGASGTPDVAVDFGNYRTTNDSTVTISADDLTSSRMETILSAFHTVTDKAGYGRPNPVNRGTAPSRRLNASEDFELVYLRHSILRRTPNPSDMKEVEKYLPVIRRAASKAIYRFRYAFNQMAFSVEDLESIGLVHTMTFLHNYAQQNPIENVRLLVEHLNQRFTELALMCSRKARSIPEGLGNTGFHLENGITPCDDASADDEYAEGEYDLVNTDDGSVHSFEVKNDGFLGVEIRIDGRLLTSSEVEQLSSLIGGQFVLVSAEEQDETVSAAGMYSRQLKARKELHDRLGAMDPEAREFALVNASLSRYVAADTNSAARSLCSELACPACSAKVSGSLLCDKCGVEAQPRYGVDYVAYRERLIAENNPLVAALTAPLSETQLRANRTAAPTKADVVKLSKPEIKVMDKAMMESTFAALPATLVCCKCHGKKAKAEFGVRIPKRHSNGAPKFASRQSRCRPCRKAYATEG